jgi:hypothetical protein
VDRVDETVKAETVLLAAVENGELQLLVRSGEAKNISKAEKIVKSRLPALCM